MKIPEIDDLIAGLLLALGVALPAASNPFGIVVHVPDHAQQDLVVELGADWVRIDFIWALVEPERDVLDWTVYDRLIFDADARGLRIFATIAGTPGWATSGSEAIGVPDDAGDWADFCYRAAARYRGRVRAWGLWNEPNLDHFWEGTRQDYIDRILMPGARAIHMADPLALVAGPELAHIDSAGWESWLKICVGVARDELDVVTHHVYPGGASASDVTEKLEQGGPYPWDPPAVKKVLKDVGWFGRPFWLTETGVESDRAGPSLQALFYDDLLSYWFPPEGTARWMDRIFFYELVDDPRYPEFTWGIVGPPPELQSKEAFDTYRSFIEEARVDDARVLSWNDGGLIRPGLQNRVVVRAVNEGTREWSPEDSLGVVIDGLPSNWDIDGGKVLERVPPGGAVDLTLALTPPDAGWGFPNIRYELIVRMARADGQGLGSPLRTAVVLGWRSLPQFILEPLGVVVTEGDDAVFRVTVQGNSGLVFSWFHNGRLVEDDSSVTGSTSARLKIRSVDAAATGEYFCRIESDAGRVDSRPARLELEGGSRSGDRAGPRRGSGRWTSTPSFRTFFGAVASDRRSNVRPSK